MADEKKPDDAATLEMLKQLQSNRPPAKGVKGLADEIRKRDPGIADRMKSIGGKGPVPAPVPKVPPKK